LTVAERAAEYAQQIIYKDREIKRLQEVLLAVACQVAQKYGALKRYKYVVWKTFLRAWAIAGVLIVHSVFPNIWQHKASDMINKR
jgi:hypothetical protein